MDRQISEEKEFEKYLANLEKDPVKLSFVFAEQVKATWQMIKHKYSTAPLPVAGPGGELGFQFAWNTEDHYLEIDIGPNGDVEWFFADRKMDWTEGSEGFPEDQRFGRMMWLLRRMFEEEK